MRPMLLPGRQLEQNGMRATGDSAAPTMKHPSENQPQEVLAGLVERVTYHNAENGFCVLRAKARGNDPRQQAVDARRSKLQPRASQSSSASAPTLFSSRDCRHT